MKLTSGIRHFFTSQSGFTLLELTVVSAILGILAGIVAFSVSGQASQGRSAAQIADTAEIQKAVDNFAGQHPQGRFPTLNGCLTGLVLDLVTLECVNSSDVLDNGQVESENLEFSITESEIDMDLNGNDDTADTLDVVPIIWAKAFLDDSGDIRRFAGSFIQREPKHAFEFFDGNDPDWKDGRNTDPDGLGDDGVSDSITAPEGLGAGDNEIDLSLNQYPVWIITESGIVFNILPPSRY